MYNTPILFILFANPDTASRVFEQIRKVQPKRLYVAADAPRTNRQGEELRCIKTRAIIEQVDWDCEVKTLFQDRNLGPETAISKAITWFFEQEEQGVILEHDCLPDLSFFPFCEELLNKYKEDTRIGHIGANCFLPAIIDDNISYDFCSMSHIWGWATWRRVWKNYDVNFSYWKQYKRNREKKNNLFNSLRERIYFSSFISDTLSKNKVNTWDAQWLFTLRTQNQLSIYPSVNMVTNIGIGDPHAVHTSKRDTKHIVPASAIEFPLKHPQYVMRNKKLDDLIIKKGFFSYKRLIRYFLKNY
jgi:hypothetical protein